MSISLVGTVPIFAQTSVINFVLLINHFCNGHILYGFKQEGNEQNLFNGYLTVDRQIEANATDLSSIEVTGNIGNITMDTYSEIRCKTPDKHVSADVNTICAIYIEDMMGLGLSNAFGIYQFGNEPNWFKGNITTSGDLNAGGDTTLNGDVDIDEDLIVTGTVDIDGTERVRAYVSSNQQTNTGNTKVEFNTENYICPKQMCVIRNELRSLGVRSSRDADWKSAAHAVETGLLKKPKREHISVVTRWLELQTGSPQHTVRGSFSTAPRRPRSQGM